MDEAARQATWCLCNAARLGHVADMRRALADGAVIDGEGPRTRTAVQDAASNCQVQSFQFLLEQGAHPDSVASDPATAVHLAVFCFSGDQRSHQILTLAARHGARLDVRDSKGRTLLHESALMGNTRNARFLLEQGADANARDGEGRTPLHLAALHEHEEVAKLLLQQGAEVDAHDRRECRPLHMAAAKESMRLCRLLRAFGANPRGIYSLSDAVTAMLDDEQLGCALKVNDPAVLVDVLERFSFRPEQVDHFLDLARQPRFASMDKVVRSWAARHAADRALSEVADNLKTGVLPC